MDFSKHIKPLQNETDYPVWKRKMRDLLDYHEGAIDVIDGRLKKPVPLPADATAENRKTFKEEADLYRKANSYAKSMITSAVSDDVYQKIMDKETAADAWESLMLQFEARSKDQLFKICIDFFSFTWNSGEDVSLHIAKLKSLWIELNNGLKARNENQLPDVLLVCKILQILPTQFETFKSSWMLLTKNEEKNFEEMSAQLCMYQRNCKSSDGNRNDEALVVRNFKKKNVVSNQNANNKSFKKTDVCNYCNKKGHWVRDCRKWINDGKPNKENNGEVKIASHQILPLICDEVNAIKEELSDSWWIDNGATRHVTNNRQLFKNFETFKEPRKIKAAGKEILNVIGKGTIEIQSKVNNKVINIDLTDVWYVPNISRNLFSVLAAQDKRKSSKFESTTTRCKLVVNNEVLLVGYREVGGSLYQADIKTTMPGTSNEVNAAEASNTLQLYHERWGHQDKRHVQQKLKTELGINVKLDKNLCESCIYGKSHRLPFGTREKASCPGELMTADVCGPFSDSFSKKRYLVIFKDCYTKYCFGYFLKQKSEVKDALKEVLVFAKTQGNSIKEFLSDNGGEFDNYEVRKMLKDFGVTQRLTAPYTPQQNGASERENRTVIEMARTFRYSNKNIQFPDAIWAELVRTAIYVLNRTRKTSVEGKSPHELWYGRKPRTSHLRIIASECYVHVPKQKRKKMDSKAVKGYLIGYDTEERYRIYVKENHGLLLSRDVKFNERTIHCDEDAKSNVSESKNVKTVKLHFKDYKKPTEDVSEEQEDEPSTSRGNQDSVNNDYQPSTEEDHQDAVEDDEMSEEYNQDVSDSDVSDFHGFEPSKRVRSSSDEEDEPISKRLRDRTILHNSKFDDYVMAAHDFVSQIETPTTYSEAVTSKGKHQWNIAMKSEIKSLQENQTWEMADLPRGSKALPSKWVYKVKTNPDGSIDKFKARLVIKGFRQREGIDYNETFSPVAKLGTIRAILSIAASQNLHLSQFDVSTAFLYGHLEESIFMKQPEGFDDGSKKVCKLRRSLYGLKQAPRCWNRRFGSFLLKLSLKPSESDPCLYMRVNGGKKLILALYVDDGLVAASDPKELELFLSQLKTEFKITTKDASYFLGLEIKKNQNGITISQEAYARKILERFRFSDCRSVSTPMLKGKETFEPGKESVKGSQFPYRQAVGAIMYLMLGTRPDLAYSIGFLSRTLENPSDDDITRVKRVFRYIAGTATYGILYDKTAEQKLQCYSDADFGGCEKTGRSTSGVVVKFANGAVSWLSQRQAIVATSTTEAEVVAASEATKEIIWLRRLYAETMGYSDIPVLQVDNSAAVRLAQNPEYHRRTKHISIKHFFVREKVTERQLEVQQISTQDQLADLMTKPLQPTRLKMLCDQIGLRDANIT